MKHLKVKKKSASRYQNRPGHPGRRAKWNSKDVLSSRGKIMVACLFNEFSINVKGWYQVGIQTKLQSRWNIPGKLNMQNMFLSILKKLG